MTVRNNKNKVVQFAYGDDNISPMNVENQGLPLAKMTLEDIYMHYQIPQNIKNEDILSVFTKSTISKMKKEKVKLNNSLIYENKDSFKNILFFNIFFYFFNFS